MISPGSRARAAVLLTDRMQCVHEPFEFRKDLFFVKMGHLGGTARTETGTASTTLADSVVDH